MDACAVIVENQFVSKNRELDAGLKSRMHPVGEGGGGDV